MKQKKKIAIIGLKGLPSFGGAAEMGENLISQLEDKYDITILSISTHTSLKTGNYNGARQVVFKSYFNTGGLNTMWYYFVSMLYVLFHKFDIVHIHHLAAGYIVPLIKLRHKTVLTIHGIKVHTDDNFGKTLNILGNFSEKIALKSANQLVSVSKHYATYLTTKSKRHIKYIPNGITSNLISDSNSNLTKNYILFSAARIYNIKGLHLLVDAANQLKLQDEIKIVGDIDRVPAYKQKILKNGKSLNLDITGLIKDRNKLKDIVKAAKLFIFPSLQEAMSMMLLEVASMKIPIIASDIPANTNLFSNDEVLFFKSDDACDLSKKIQYALSNMDEMRERTEKAHSKLINNFTWNEIAKQYTGVYEELISSRTEDFTVKIYQQLLQTCLHDGYRFITMEEYCTGMIKDKFIILRHDVDLKVENSLITAKVEFALGIKASYYFRDVPQSWDAAIIKQIAQMGHEVGYHYETLTKCNGNIDEAYKLFCDTLEKLRLVAEVKTICMHGSPTSKWDSKDIWEKYDYKELGIIGEPYFDIDFSDLFYITDTGRRWDGYNVSVRDRIPLYQDRWTKQGLVFHSTRDIINTVKAGKFPKRVMITTHPQRWTDDILQNIKEYCIQNTKNIIKSIIIRIRR